MKKEKNKEIIKAKNNKIKRFRKWKYADVDDKGKNNTNAERQRKGQGSK